MMRALLSLALDLLARPYWFTAVVTGFLVGIGLIVIANDRAKAHWRRAEIEAIKREAEYEWARQQRPQIVHRAARSIVDSHPDHRFNLSDEDRSVLADLGISPDGPQRAA